MPASRRIYLDSNIFIRMLENKDDSAAALLQLLGGALRGREPCFATSELTLAELLVKPYRDANVELMETYDRWTTASRNIQVAGVGRNVLKRAALMRANFPVLKLPDAIHIASAITLECSHLLTADLRLSGSYSLTIPQYDEPQFPMGTTTRTVDVLRPELDVINQVLEELT